MEEFQPYIRRNPYNPSYWNIVLRPGYIFGSSRGPFTSYKAASEEIKNMIESGEFDEYCVFY